MGEDIEGRSSGVRGLAWWTALYIKYQIKRLKKCRRHKRSGGVTQRWIRTAGKGRFVPSLSDSKEETNWRTKVFHNIITDYCPISEAGSNSRFRHYTYTVVAVWLTRSDLPPLIYIPFFYFSASVDTYCWLNRRNYSGENRKEKHWFPPFELMGVKSWVVAIIFISSE